MADEEEKKPNAKFLSAQDPDTWAKPPETSWGDYSLHPTKPLTPAAKKLCQLVAGGMKQGKACEQVGYTQGWASRILTSSKGKAEIQRFQEKMFEASVADRVKELGTPALDLIEELLLSDDPQIKPQLKADLAKWIAEKVSGRPKQEIEHSGNMLGDFMSRVQQIQESGQVIDVTPTTMDKLEANEGHGEAEGSSEKDKLDQFLTFDAKDLET